MDARACGGYPEGLERFVNEMQSAEIPLPSFVGLVNSIGQTVSEKGILLLNSLKRHHGSSATNVFVSAYTKSKLPYEVWVQGEELEPVTS